MRSLLQPPLITGDASEWSGVFIWAHSPSQLQVSFGAEMSPAKVVVGRHGSGADCSEAEEEESIYSEEESGSEAADDF